MLQSTAPGMPHEIWVRTQKLVSDEVKKQYGLTDFKVSVLWFAWFSGGMFVPILAKDWRALAVSSGLPYSVYFEISYDSTSNSYYIDRYTSEDRTVIPGV